MSGSAGAGSLHQGSLGSSGLVVGVLPGSVLYTYYLTTQLGELCPPGTGADGLLCNTQGAGDNIIRLVNPNGAANGNLSGARTQPVCAMIYVLDDDEEMGECCGCPLSSAQLATFSVENNLTSDWALQGSEAGAHGNGAIAIVAAAPNASTTCTGNSLACHGGCDPSNVPGYSVTFSSNLMGSITHDQMVAPEVHNITETSLSDDADGDSANLVYLQSQCGALLGNGSHGGVCNCPIE
jgi:hypothetical protein